MISSENEVWSDVMHRQRSGHLPKKRSKIPVNGNSISEGKCCQSIKASALNGGKRTSALSEKLKSLPGDKPIRISDSEEGGGGVIDHRKRG